jgi:hypothetical protein
MDRKSPVQTMAGHRGVPAELQEFFLLEQPEARFLEFRRGPLPQTGDGDPISCSFL